MWMFSSSSRHEGRRMNSTRFRKDSYAASLSSKSVDVYGMRLACSDFCWGWIEHFCSWYLSWISSCLPHFLYVSLPYQSFISLKGTFAFAWLFCCWIPPQIKNKFANNSQESAGNDYGILQSGEINQNKPERGQAIKSTFHFSTSHSFCNAVITIIFPFQMRNLLLIVLLIFWYSLYFSGCYWWLV